MRCPPNGVKANGDITIKEYRELPLGKTIQKQSQTPSNTKMKDIVEFYIDPDIILISKHTAESLLIYLPRLKAERLG